MRAGSQPHQSDPLGGSDRPGRGVAGELGITVPDADRLPTELGNKFDHLYRWLDHEAADDLARPDITDPTLIAATRLINAILPATYFAEDLATHGWLSLEALRIWIEHGPGRTLIGPASTGVFTAVALGGDYSRGYRAMRRILALGEAAATSPTRRRRATCSQCRAAGRSRSKTASTRPTAPARV